MVVDSKREKVGEREGRKQAQQDRSIAQQQHPPHTLPTACHYSHPCVHVHVRDRVRGPRHVHGPHRGHQSRGRNHHVQSQPLLIICSRRCCEGGGVSEFAGSRGGKRWCHEYGNSQEKRAGGGGRDPEVPLASTPNSNPDVERKMHPAARHTKERYIPLNLSLLDTSRHHRDGRESEEEWAMRGGGPRRIWWA